MEKGINIWKDRIPGILLCAAIALPAWLLGKAVPVVGGPVFSIFLGMIITFLEEAGFLSKGDDFYG